MLSKILHIIATIVAIALILVGIVTFPMPIPLGAVFILLGLGLLVTTNAAFALWLRNFRERHPDMEDKIRKAERWLPGPLRLPIDKTRPDSDTEQTPR